jgi:hypothetical protein
MIISILTHVVYIYEYDKVFIKQPTIQQLKNKTMKKILLTGIAVLGIASLFSCERTNKTDGDDLGDNKSVVHRDTIVTEYDVKETIVEYDTTTRTKSVDAEDNR